MRISFAGNRVGFSLRYPSLDHRAVSEDQPHVSFALDPEWTDLTPDYDPTGRRSELDLLQDAKINLSGFSVALDWQPGAAEYARQRYSDELRLMGLPQVEIEDCKTILAVVEDRLYVTCFLPDDVYESHLSLCERFAAWPSPKAYSGRVELPLLHNGLFAALNPTDFLAFWAGELPLYSNRWIGFSVVQNGEVQKPPTDQEKHHYHLSRI